MTKKKQKFVQCRMEREIDGVMSQTTSWLPTEFAEVGRIIDLKDETWSEGWTVVQAGPFVDDPLDWRKAIREHRKRTGDSNPKP